MIPRYFFVTIIFFIFFSFIYPQKNPFITPSGEDNADSEIRQEEESPEHKDEKEETSASFWSSAYGYFISSMVSLQRKLYKKVETHADKLREGFGLKTALLSFLTVFLYGLIHAAGPGHGKIFSISYFAGRNSTPVHGVFFGFLFAVIHTGSAVLLASLFYLLLRSGFIEKFELMSNYLRSISFSVIFVFGLYIFVSVFHSIKKREGSEDKNREIPLKKTELKKNSLRSLVFMAFSVGVVPCPGTFMILIFFMGMGLFYFGIFLSVAMMLGMAFTISLLGLFVIIFRKKALSFLNNSGRSFYYVKTFLELSASLFLMTAGAMLFTASL